MVEEEEEEVMDEEQGLGNDEVAGFWEDFSRDETARRLTWVPPVGGIGGIFAMMGQAVDLTVDLNRLLGLENRGDDGDLEQQRQQGGDTPWGGGHGDDDEDEGGQEYEDNDDDGDGWMPTGAHGWAPVPVALEDILAGDGFVDYDEFGQLDGSDPGDWAVEEDGGIVSGGRGVDFPWGNGGGGGDDDEYGGDEREHGGFEEEHGEEH
ncbi:hypothetical protein VPNG_00111 [Cytospora leucostoma]|uniref:Uncharacterized protein n=1 Tax=Cytospora leucostoma TaxID=1230097 RepID=A0A423XP56_9PEZI|nr:hypothetical protein VPNG_00111 [Cytospora leucostoma]